MTEPPARAAGTVEIAGKKVSRLGFGAMRLTGLGVWGEPEDREECLRVLHRAVDLGVQLIDTADSYGPHVSEEIIREALHPYPEDVLIATKAGLTRYGPDVISTEQGPVRVGPRQWSSVGRPEYLRQQAVMSLRRLGLECIDLFQLHRVDPQVPLEDQVGELRALQNEGKIVAIGLSEVSVDEIRRARQIADIATVQNRYNLTDRTSADVLDYCTREGIGFIPWAPVGAGELARPGGPVHRIATAHEASPSQIALSWLLARSEVILPIPGTSKVTHLEDNIAAASLRLTAQEIDELTDATASSTTRETATAAPSDRHWSSEELAVIGGSDDVLITEPAARRKGRACRGDVGGAPGRGRVPPAGRRARCVAAQYRGAARRSPAHRSQGVGRGVRPDGRHGHQRSDRPRLPQ